MSNKYIVVEKDGQKWLRPVNVPYPNEDDQDNEGVFQLADAVLYKQLTADLPYIGNHPAGTTLGESQVREIRQHRHESGWYECALPYIDWPTDRIKTRTAYTDADSLSNRPESDKQRDLSAGGYKQNADYWERRARSAEAIIDKAQPDFVDLEYERLTQEWQQIIKEEPK